MSARRAAVALGGALLVAALAACGHGSDGSTAPSGAGSTTAPLPGAPPLAAVGQGEGALDLVVPVGYTDDAAWIAPFTQQTGCAVRTTPAATAEEAVRLLHSGRFDGASIASGQALRLVLAGDAAQLDTALVRSYADLSDGLRNAAFATYHGTAYGIPSGFRATLLVWRTAAMATKPGALADLFGPTAQAHGRVAIPDDPLTLAAAALYLQRSEPALGIRDAFVLDRRQLAAAAEVVSRATGAVGAYARDAAAVTADVAGGASVAGLGLAPAGSTGGAGPVGATVPREGALGTVDLWMMSSRSRHPSCMYLWMDYASSPDVQAQVARHDGEAPANPKACDLLDASDPGLCAALRAGDTAFVRSLVVERTPLVDCGDARGSACTGYADWVRAWRDATR